MPNKDANERCRDLTNLVKNIVIGFCKINVPYAERLDIYGSLHFRADDCDIANFMLNEHCYNNSAASSPTVTSAQSLTPEAEGNDEDTSQGGHGSQKSVPAHTVKTETSAMAADTQNDSSNLQHWQWPDAELVTSQDQPRSFSQPSGTTDQPTSSWSSNSASLNFGTVSKYFPSSAGPDGDGRVKTEAAVNGNQLLNDGIIEITDDDMSESGQDNNYINNDVTDPTEFKPEFLKTEDGYDAEMPYEYEDYLQYDDASAAGYQYSNVSANSYFSQQPRAANSANRRRKSNLSQNIPSTSEKICKYCRERFVSDAELSAHFLQYHQCTMPPANQKRKTQSHQIDPVPSGQLVHENIVQMYRCRFCGQMFKSLDGLRNHENVKHSGSKRYRCSFCSEEFLTRQAAYVHRVKFHRLLVRKMQ